MSDLLLARRRVSRGLASVPVGSDKARPTRTVPTSTPSTRPLRRGGGVRGGADKARPPRAVPTSPRSPRPLRRGGDGRGGTFRCCGQPPLRSISVVSFDTGGEARVRAISGGGGVVGRRAPR